MEKEREKEENKERPRILKERDFEVTKNERDETRVTTMKRRVRGNNG